MASSNMVANTMVSNNMMGPQSVYMMPSQSVQQQPMMPMPPQMQMPNANASCTGMPHSMTHSMPAARPAASQQPQNAKPRPQIQLSGFLEPPVAHIHSFEI